MKTSRRILGRILLAAALSIAAAGRAPAAPVRSLEIESFDAEVMVLPSGAIDVTETIRPRFTGSWQGIYRSIPVDYRTARGFDYRLRLSIEEVKDGEGTPLRYEPSNERHYRKIKIYIPGAADVSKTVTLRYRVEQALRFFEDHDELYWNVTGDEWEVPIKSAAASIALPRGASGVRAEAFSGAYGSRASDAEVRVLEDGEVRFRMRRALGFHEGLTVVVGWDKGIVREPGAFERATLFLRSNFPLALPLVAFVVMLWLWSTRGRDPRLNPIVARYDPPEGLSPAEVGALADGRADLRDVTATIVDLAVRGYLRIEEKDTPGLLGLWSSHDYVFRMLKPRSQWGEIRAHEKALLEAVFSGQLHLPEAAGPATVLLSDLQNKFYRDLPGIRSHILNQLVERGLYRGRPDQVRNAYLFGGGTLLVVGVLLSQVLAGRFAIAPVTLVAAFGISALIVVGFGWFMPARTVAGGRALEGVLGLEEFLSRVEADRLDRTIRTPEMFEKCLPYAMALGVEANWVKAFEGIYREPPGWYRGTSPGTFSLTHLGSSLSRMSTTAAAVMTSAPRSASGSGFSGGGGGGGSSGGGFGGGGGGGF